MSSSIIKLTYLTFVLFYFHTFSQEKYTIKDLQKNFSYEELKKILYHRKDSIIPLNDSLKSLIIKDKYSEIANLISFDKIKQAISIYDYDNRLDIEDVIYSKVKQNAQGVGILVNYEDFNDNYEGFLKFKKENDSLLKTAPFIFKMNKKYILNTKTLQRRYYNLCNSIRFIKQPSLTNSCTAFAISDKYILTAAHCVKDKNLSKMRIAFNYIKTGDNYGKTIDKNDIYRIKLIHIGKLGEDYAVLKIKGLWKKLPQKRHLKFNLEYDYNTDENLYLLGHPLGLPMKFSDDAKLKNKIGNYFIAKIDAHSGNSGSPVFNQKNEVIGILSGGSSVIFRISERRNCKTWGICNYSLCEGEKIFKIGRLRELLTKLNIKQ